MNLRFRWLALLPLLGVLLACSNNSDVPQAPPLYNQSTPQAVTLPASVTTPAAGWAMSCAVLADGTLRCWGDDSFGQLGDTASGVACYGGYAACSNGPVAVAAPPATWQRVSAGYAHACGLDNAGAAWCWGYGYDGQLGSGSATRSSVPVAVTGALSFNRIAVSLSGPLSCGITTGNALYCWGTAFFGQPGTGVNAAASASPYRIGPSQNFTAVAVGDAHTCALDAGGLAYCWGANNYGQVGDGTTTDRSVPTAVLGGRTYTAIVAGVAHTCALRSDGTVDCWGAGGLIGRATTTTTEQATPTAVTGAPSFTTLVAGAWHTCALTGAGATWCWGDNSRTQFGDGTTTAGAVPRAITALPTFAQLAAGAGHTCGVTAGGVMSCWGANTFGQTGRLP